MKRTTLLTATSLVLGSVILMGNGCGLITSTSTNTVTDNTNTVVDTDVQETSIEITAPADGATVASTFDLTVNISDDFTLAPDKVEGENAEGEGHYHVWVDGEYFAAGVATTTSIADLTAGEHELQVSLQNNDHTDLATAVKSETITVTVE